MIKRQGIEVNEDDDVRLPRDICLPYNVKDGDLDRLIDCIFPRLNENMQNKDYIISRAILSTRNKWVDMINIKMRPFSRGSDGVP